MLAIRQLRPALANWSLRIQYGWLSDWHRISTPPGWLTSHLLPRGPTYRWGVNRESGASAEKRRRRSAPLIVEEIQGDRSEERRDGQVVVGQARQDRQRMTTLGSAFAHPAPITETPVKQLEHLDVVARRCHVGICCHQERRHLEAA